MKLIIDIPDKVYNEYREGVMSMENNCIIGNAVFDGIPYEEKPQGDLISRSALIQHAYSAVVDGVEKDIIDLSDVDNAPTVFDDKAYSDGYTQGTCDCEHAHERPQGEITNEDIQQAIKEGFANGYEMAKEKIIHSIAKQYSEHNELVPMWLSIGDIKDGAV